MKRTHKMILMLFIIFPFMSAGYVYASDYDRLVTCSTKTCTISSNDPLFTEFNWSQGASVTKTIRVKNMQATSLLIYISADKNNSSSNLGDVIGMKIIEQKNSIVRLDTTLTHFFNTGSVELGGINGNGQDDYKFIAALENNAGNTYQNKKVVFSLALNFSGIPVNTPMPTPTPTPKPPPPLRPNFNFWWLQYLLERLRGLRR